MDILLKREDVLRIETTHTSRRDIVTTTRLIARRMTKTGGMPVTRPGIRTVKSYGKGNTVTTPSPPATLKPPGEH